VSRSVNQDYESPRNRELADKNARHYQVRDTTGGEPDTAFETHREAYLYTRQENRTAGWLRFYWVRINGPF